MERVKEEKVINNRNKIDTYKKKQGILATTQDNPVNTLPDYTGYQRLQKKIIDPNVIADRMRKQDNLYSDIFGNGGVASPTSTITSPGRKPNQEFVNGGWEPILKTR